MTGILGNRKKDIIEKAYSDIISADNNSITANEYLENVNKVSKEQTNNLNKINKSIIDFKSILQNIATSTEESAAASEELSSQSEILKKTATILDELINGKIKNQSTKLKYNTSQKNLISKQLVPIKIDIEE